MFYLPAVMALDICYMILIILDNELLALIMNLQKESTIKVNIMPMNERTLNKKKLTISKNFQGNGVACHMHMWNDIIY